MPLDKFRKTSRIELADWVQHGGMCVSGKKELSTCRMQLRRRVSSRAGGCALSEGFALFLVGESFGRHGRVPEDSIIQLGKCSVVNEESSR
jgi:hypothetical protein